MQKMFRVNVRPAQKDWHEKSGMKSFGSKDFGSR